MKNELINVNDEYMYNNVKTSLINADLLFCGHQVCSSTHSFGPHVRSSYVIHYVVSGKGIFRNSYATYKLGPGCSFFIFPGEFTYYEADKDDPWEYYWVGVNELSSPATPNTSFDLFLPHSILTDQPCFFTNTENNLCELFTQLHKIRKENTDHSPLKTVSLFYDIMYNYFHLNNEFHLLDKREGIISNQLLSGIDFMKANFQKKLNLNQVADHVGLSRSHFSKQFKKAFNVSPVNFLVKYRLMVAASMLISTDYSIEYISNYCGYNDYNYFSNQFHQHYHYSPTNFRRNRRHR